MILRLLVVLCVLVLMAYNQPLTGQDLASPNQIEQHDITVKVKWLKRQFLTYQFKKGDSVRITFRAISKPKGGGLGSFSSRLSQAAGNKLPQQAGQLQEQGGNPLSSLPGGQSGQEGFVPPAGKTGTIGQFSFIRQGGGPLFQGVKVGNFDQTFYIPSNGNYSLIFKNNTILTKYFELSIIRVRPPLGKPVQALDTIRYDTIAQVILEKQFSLAPLKDLNNKSEYIIPIDFSKDPSLLGLSYIVTTNKHLSDTLQSQQGIIGPFSRKDPAKSFNFDKRQFASSNSSSGVYFNFLLNGTYTLSRPDLNYVGIISPIALQNNSLELYLKSKEKVRRQKIYVKIIQYVLELSPDEQNLTE